MEPILLGVETIDILGSRILATAYSSSPDGCFGAPPGSVLHGAAQQARAGPRRTPAPRPRTKTAIL